MSSQAQAVDLFIGDRGPDFTLKSQRQENLRLAEQRGRIVALSFWSKWCRSCQQQLTDLRQLQAAAKPQDLQIWIIQLSGENYARQKKMQLEANVHWLVDQHHEAARRYQVNELPKLVVIDRDGNIAYMSTQPDTNTAPIQQLLNQTKGLDYP